MVLREGQGGIFIPARIPLYSRGAGCSLLVYECAGILDLGHARCSLVIALQQWLRGRYARVLLVPTVTSHPKESRFCEKTPPRMGEYCLDGGCHLTLDVLEFKIVLDIFDCLILKYYGKKKVFKTSCKPIG